MTRQIPYCVCVNVQTEIVCLDQNRRIMYQCMKTLDLESPLSMGQRKRKQGIAENIEMKGYRPTKIFESKERK